METTSQIDTIRIVVEILTFLVLSFGLATLFVHRKQVFFSTVNKCINHYRNIIRKQQSLEGKKNNDKNKRKHLILVKDHLGLVSEELFYMQKKYLPRKLSKDWLKNMINFIPIFYKNKNGTIILNVDKIIESKELKQYCSLENSNIENYLKETEEFPKIRRVFTIDNETYNNIHVNGEINFDSEKVKKKLVNRFWGNRKKKH